MDELLLTDDEVVALAADQSTFWPGGSPTIAETDPVAVSAASFRGHRSLAVRRLLGDEGLLDSAISEYGAQLPGSETFIAVFLANTEFRRASWGIATTHYPLSTGWVLETVSPIGIHRLSSVPADLHRIYFEAMLMGAEQAGPEDLPGTIEDSDRPMYVCILSVSPNGSVLASARRGQICAGPRSIIDGQVANGTALTPTTALAAAASLMEHVESPLAG